MVNNSFSVKMSVNSDASDVEETVCEKLASQIETTAQKRLSAFAEHDLVIKIENTKLYVNQEQLMTESSVFKEKLTSLSKNLTQKEIELVDKNVKTFVDFLRCTLPGIDEHMTDDTVHEVLPLAEEYAATKTLDKADKFLAEKCRQMDDKISSDQIVKNILQAELYNLTTYLEECVTIASRKRFKNVAKTQQFNDITMETRLKITMKRWNDIDEAIDATGQINEVTPIADFYKPLNPFGFEAVNTSGPAHAIGFSTTPRPAKTKAGGFNFSSSTASLVNRLKLFMQSN